MAYRIVHQGWQLLGQILIVDEDGNAIVLGKDPQTGAEIKVGTVQIAVDRFRGNAFEDAYRKACIAASEILAKYQPLVGEQKESPLRPHLIEQPSEELQ